MNIDILSPENVEKLGFAVAVSLALLTFFFFVVKWLMKHIEQIEINHISERTKWYNEDKRKSDILTKVIENSTRISTEQIAVLRENTNMIFELKRMLETK